MSKLSGLNRRFFSTQDERQFRVLLVAACTLLAALVLVLGFYLGFKAAYSGMGLDKAAFREMESQIPQLHARVSELENTLDVERTRSAVDQQALEMVRKDIALQKDQIALLEEGLRFYKSLMSPGEIAQGLSLRPVELVALDESGGVGFRIVVQQEALKHSMVKGQLSLSINGLENDQQVSYTLADLSDDLGGETLDLRFRYFQSIEGELTLPEGFEPKDIELVAAIQAPRKTELREQFPWQIQEHFTHVGQ